MTIKLLLVPVRVPAPGGPGRTGAPDAAGPGALPASTGALTAGAGAMPAGLGVLPSGSDLR